MTDKKTLDFIFSFTKYIEDNASVDFFNGIFGGNCPDWNDRTKIYNHFYHKFHVENERSGEKFFTSLDKGNMNRMMFYYIVKEDLDTIVSPDKIDDILRRFYSYYPLAMNNKIWNILCDKDAVVKLFNEKCYP